MVRQQTPKPDAQLPDAEAPVLDSHSVEVRHTPNITEVICVVHWSFGKLTTLKSENAFPTLVSEGMATAVEARKRRQIAKVILKPRNNFH